MSGITRIAKYRTEDGEEHLTEADARNHLVFMETKAKLKQAYAPALATQRPEALLTAILNDPIVMRDALTNLIRRNKIKIENEETPERLAA